MKRSKQPNRTVNPNFCKTAINSNIAIFEPGAGWRAWFLEITFNVRVYACVCVCVRVHVCVCVRPRGYK